MSTSTEVIEQLANTEYKYGFVTDVEQDIVPKGLNEDVVRLISAKKGEPEWLLEWRLKAYRVVAQDDRADVAERQVRADRLPGHQLLRRAEGEEEAGQHGRSRSRDPRDVRQAGHPADRAAVAGRRRRRCRVRLGFGGDDVPREAGEAGHHLLLVLRSGARASRSGEAVPRLGRSAHRQLLRHAQLGGLQRRQLRLRAEGRALPDGAVHLLPHQRQGHRPVRADADRLRRGRDGQLSRRAARRPSATRTSCTPRSSSSWRSTTPPSSTRRCRTGIPATSRARAASTTS